MDIAGSTKLKNINNYSKIQKYCEQFVKLESELGIKNQKTNTEKLIDVYSKIRNEVEFKDWSEIIRDCFSDFNTEFIIRRGGNNVLPWKMAGDELIYCLDVQSRHEVHKNVLAFFNTIRYLDKQYLEQKDSRIRLKGSAWTAGFPIRNRIMAPFSFSVPDENCKKIQNCIVNNEDYMGPEIDIGFRIGKCTFPGMIVVSLELACILLDPRLEIPNEEKLIVRNPGWEALKGVWEGKKYPILWLDLPKIVPNDKKNPSNIDYKPFTIWDCEENYLVKNFANDNTSTITYQFLKNLISSLPPQFDVIEPYFLTDGEKIPNEHITRQEFINAISNHDFNSQPQDSSNSGEIEMDSVNSIIKDALK